MDSGQIENLYNRAARIIIELNEELSDLTIKFGSTSRLVARKALQLNTLIELHDETKEEYYRLVNIALLSRALNNYKDIVIMQNETGLPWAKVAKLLGYAEDWGKDIQTIDDKVKEHHVKLREILGEDYETRLNDIIRNGGAKEDRQD